MNLKFKILKIKNLHSYLKTHHGVLVSNDYCDYCNYYECDNNVLVVENAIAKIATIYFDREKVYEGERKRKEMESFSAFKSKQEIVKSIESHKKLLLQELIEEINLKKEHNLSKVDLEKLDRKIKTYGYEKAIKYLYLNLIVFAGEYIREKRDGEWRIIRNPEHKSEKIPVFVDSTERSYYYDINVVLLKTFNKNGRFSMKEIIDFALLPAFQVSKKDVF